MIVQTQDFRLDAYIPNKDDAPFSDLIGNETELQGFIDIYEKEALVRVLGFELYEEYIAVFETDGSYKPATDQKWKDLTDGKGAYRGIKPLLIGYIFWKFIESDDSHYSTTHVVRENSENASNVESRPKALIQYKKFYEYAIGTYYSEPGVFEKPSIFGNLSVVFWSAAGGSGSNFKSLYQYLTEKQTDLPTWSPENLKHQNYFDI